MTKIKWYIKQIIPLRYVSHYIEDGVRKKTVFRMWFGRVFGESTETNVGDMIPDIFK